MFYEVILILLHVFLKSNIFNKVTYRVLTAVCSYRNTFSDEDKNSHHMK